VKEAKSEPVSDTEPRGPDPTDPDDYRCTLESTYFVRRALLELQQHEHHQGRR
jgi:hypothetical protein